MKRTLVALALGTGLLSAATLAVAVTVADQQALFSHSEIHADRSLLSFDSRTIDPGLIEDPGAQHRLIALPPDATWAEVVLVEGPAGATARVVRELGYLRGLPMALVAVEPGPTAGGDRAQSYTIELRHDGDWSTDRQSAQRRHARSFDALVAGSLPPASTSMNGSYLILTAEAYLEAVEPLVAWKRAKGFDVQVVTTDTTGGTRAQIQAWLREIYQSWETPPEYLLLVGDVDDIPTWDFSGNPTDHPYTLMDEGDWLPDLFLGRLSVENVYEAQTVINKTVNYERNPDDGTNPDWYRRFLGVAGNAGSVTPVNTVEFCAEQLEGMGFEHAWDSYDPGTPWNLMNLHGVYSPPLSAQDVTVPMITELIDGGVGLVVYRGWAYGVKGWEPPYFITDNIPGLSNGAMTPIVMSFVCLNGDYSVNSGGDVVCFGEVWTRAGTPTEPRGAVAFIGNGEHWSHTRYNDAMAIAYYERITDPAITTLGGLAVAGKLRFMDYFPHQLDETGNEESVEFYVHIYNLLGDPELNFWRAVPTALDVSHDGVIPAGANRLTLDVNEDGGGVLSGARVGVVQGDRLLGCAFSGADGAVEVLFDDVVAAEGDLTLTVTHPDRIPYQGSITPDDSEAFLAATAFSLDDTAGNGDGLANPGETLDLLLTLSNGGGQAATGVSATLLVPAGVTPPAGPVGFPDIPAGGSAAALAAYTITLDPLYEDGRLPVFGVTTSHAAGLNSSAFQLGVAGPAPTVTATAFGAPGNLAPGQSVELVVTMLNAGSVDAMNLSATLVLQNPALGTVVDADGSWGALAVDGSADNAGDPFVLQLSADVPHGAALPLLLELSDDGRAMGSLPLALTAGLNNPAAPMGPDAHGYYAFDSADLLYEQRPVYGWNELSTLFGGTGTKLNIAADNSVYLMPMIALPFDFTYYGQTVSEVRIADNGWVSFDPTEPIFNSNPQPLDFYNWTLPNRHGSHSIIAPFYDNLTVIAADSLSGSAFIDGIYYEGDAAAGTFTVEWSRLRHYRPEITDLQSFQLVLYDPVMHPTASGDGEILFQYRQVNNADWSRGYATIGMEDHSETDGLQLSYSGVNATGMAPIGPGLAVKLTTEPPSYDPFLLAAFTATPSADGGTGLALSWHSEDPRPVLSWRLYRMAGSQREFLAELPADGGRYLDAAADPAIDQVYRLTALHPYGAESELGPFHSLVDNGSSLRLSLGQSLPNPMRERSRIDYVLPEAGPISMRIYDTAGRLVRSLADGPAEAGAGSLVWDGRDGGGRHVPAGVYFYRLRAEGRVLTRKMMVLR